MPSPPLPSSIQPLPTTITTALPISHWDVYFHILATQLQRDLPDCDETQRINLALCHLQLLACGDVALDSLGEYRKDLRRRAHGGVARGRVKALMKRCLKRVFDF